MGEYFLLDIPYLVDQLVFPLNFLVLSLSVLCPVLVDELRLVLDYCLQGLPCRFFPLVSLPFNAEPHCAILTFVLLYSIDFKLLVIIKSLDRLSRLLFLARERNTEFIFCWFDILRRYFRLENFQRNRCRRHGSNFILSLEYYKGLIGLITKLTQRNRSQFFRQRFFDNF